MSTNATVIVAITSSNTAFNQRRGGIINSVIGC